MTKLDRVQKAHALVLISSASLLTGAILFQHLGGLHPCEMCLWQRWPHLAAIILGLWALMTGAPRIRRILIATAGGAMATSGAIAVYHLGVERKWWLGHTACAAGGSSNLSAADLLRQIMATPLIRCDQAQWTIAGLSLADLNAIASLGAAAVVFRLLTKTGAGTMAASPKTTIRKMRVRPEVDTPER